MDQRAMDFMAFEELSDQESEMIQGGNVPYWENIFIYDNDNGTRNVPRKNSRRNTITIRRLPPGSYSIRYQVKVRRGNPNLPRERFNPRQRFDEYGNEYEYEE